MQTPLITTFAALALAGTTLAANDFRKTCSGITLTNLNGVKGRSMMLQADCSVAGETVRNQLDLNTCFGWSADSCGFTYPPAGHFTDTVTSCDNDFDGGDENFGNNFGCRGPCNGKGDVHNAFDLNSYVGNWRGHLVCEN